MPGRATPGPGGRLEGSVAAFDDDRGMGTVTADDGRSFSFHCTAIADGSRTIGVGTRVAFTIAAGHLGRWEATDLGPCS